MKKVVRLTENDLGRLVRRIISETPFDVSGLPRYHDGDDNEIMDLKTKKFMDAEKISKEFEKSGAIIPMNAWDVRFLLSIASKDKTLHAQDKGRIDYIQSLLDSVMRKHHTKF
jgi:hypothetical protein